MRWTDEAQKAIERVPFFIRRRVKRRVEEEATKVGSEVVTLEHVISCQRRFLDRMEEEVKGYRVETCFGPTGCPNRAVKSQDLASLIDSILSGKDLRGFLKRKVHGPLKLHHEFRVSVSDCPNACSRPQICDIGLIGFAGVKVSEQRCQMCQACLDACKEGAIVLEGAGPVVKEHLCLGCGQCVKACPTDSLTTGALGYRILVGGKLGRHPRLAEELPGVFGEDQVLRIVQRVVEFYMARSSSGERLGEILEQMGWKEFLNELSPQDI